MEDFVRSTRRRLDKGCSLRDAGVADACRIVSFLISSRVITFPISVSRSYNVLQQPVPGKTSPCLLSHQSHIASIFLIQLPQFLFSVDIRFIKTIHGATTQIITAVAEVTGPAALVQPLLDNADPFLSCGIFDQYAFDLHMPSPFS